jgi:hypothetical protein
MLRTRMKNEEERRTKKNDAGGRRILIRGVILFCVFAEMILFCGNWMVLVGGGWWAGLFIFG